MGKGIELTAEAYSLLEANKGESLSLKRLASEAIVLAYKPKESSSEAAVFAEQLASKNGGPAGALKALGGMPWKSEFRMAVADKLAAML